jgi:hypothetical protein
VKHERKRHGISQSRAEFVCIIISNLTPSNSENAASSANLEPASSIFGFNISTTSGSSTEQRGLSNFSNGLESRNCSSNGLSDELDDFLNGVAGQDSSSNGLSNRFSSWPVEHSGLLGGVAGQSSCSDGFSGWLGEHGGLPDGVAGQNSPGNGLSNGLGGPLTG